MSHAEPSVGIFRQARQADEKRLVSRAIIIILPLPVAERSIQSNLQSYHGELQLGSCGVGVWHRCVDCQDVRRRVLDGLRTRQVAGTTTSFDTYTTHRISRGCGMRPLSYIRVR